MKRKNFFTVAALAALAALASLSLQSCNDKDDEYYLAEIYPNAVVTVKAAENGRLYLQLDDRTTLLPANLTTSPFDGKEVRALTNIRPTHGQSNEYDRVVHINWIDSMRTKTTVPFVADQNDLYGTAPLEVVDDWITLVEDGYLTLHLLVPWSDPATGHRINLLTGVNPDDPYEVELRHDPRGDGESKMSNAYIAFRLDALPDTEGETVKLRLVWKSRRGNRSAEFDYRTRE